MPRVKKLDLGMTALDELFMNDKERAENKLPKIFDIPLSEIDDFPDHPYRVLDDEDMQNLMESIKDRGVITPAMVRKKDDGRYEMISGHRRKHASERLGLETLRCEVVEVSRDEAIILMVDSNSQRSEIAPTDKGKAYKMKLEAIKRQQGERTDLTSVSSGQKLNGKTSREILAENSEDSNTQIQRYIRLTNLVPELQDFVDKGQMKMRPAVELSYRKNGTTDGENSGKNRRENRQSRKENGGNFCKSRQNGSTGGSSGGASGIQGGGCYGKSHSRRSKSGDCRNKGTCCSHSRRRMGCSCYYRGDMPYRSDCRMADCQASATPQKTSKGDFHPRHFLGLVLIK